MRNSRNPIIVSTDNQFILTGDKIALNTNLTIAMMTAELDGAVIFCGTSACNLLGNFTLRAYSKLDS